MRKAHHSLPETSELEIQEHLDPQGNGLQRHSSFSRFPPETLTDESIPRDKERQPRRAPSNGMERRFLKLLRKKQLRFPEWYMYVRISSKKEDQHGVDFHIKTTDVGEIPVQLKSSFAGVRHHEERWPRSPAITIILKDHYSDEEILEKTFNFVGERRERRLGLLRSS